MVDSGNKVTFAIAKPALHGGFSLPAERTFLVNFKDIARGNALLNGVYTTFDGTIRMRAGDVVEIVDAAYPDPVDKLEAARLILSRYQGSTLRKILRYWDGKYIRDVDEMMKFIKRRFPRDVYLAALEAIE